jgi:hypothetical protein
MLLEPQGHTHEEQIAWRVQGFLIRAAVQAGKPIPALPGVETLAEDLKLLVERQAAETRLALLMEILSSKSAEQARGMLLSNMAAEQRKKIDACNQMLKGEAMNELQREGGEDNSSFYPPKKT